MSSAFHLQEHHYDRLLITPGRVPLVEFRPALELVAGHGLLYLGHHLLHRVGDFLFIDLVILRDDVDGVAHYHRRISRVEDDDRLPLLRPSDLLQPPSGGEGELVNVLAGARTRRGTRYGADHLGVAYG